MLCRQEHHHLRQGLHDGILTSKKHWLLLVSLHLCHWWEMALLSISGIVCETAWQDQELKNRWPPFCLHCLYGPMVTSYWWNTWQMSCPRGQDHITIMKKDPIKITSNTTDQSDQTTVSTKFQNSWRQGPCSTLTITPSRSMTSPTEESKSTCSALSRMKRIQNITL